MSVAFDLDFTLCLLTGPIPEAAPRILGSNRAGRMDISRWCFGLPREEFTAIFEHLVETEALAELPIADGTTNVLWQWSDNGHRLVYLTARKYGRPELFDSIQEQTRYWLARHKFPQAYNLIFTDSMTGKVAVCGDQKLEILLDDHSDTIRACRGTLVRGYLMSNPHNKDATDLNKCRVASLQELELREPGLATTTT